MPISPFQTFSKGRQLTLARKVLKKIGLLDLFREIHFTRVALSGIIAFIWVETRVSAHLPSKSVTSLHATFLVVKLPSRYNV